MPARAVGDPTLWLGSAVSATSPLHRDPRPNLFVQMAGRKRVVLFEPKQGETVIGKLLGKETARKRLRGEEMMEGLKRAKVDEWVWGAAEITHVQQEHKGCENTTEVSLDQKIFGYEIEVGSGDGVFIPKGWWHAVRAVREVDEETGVEGVCASVYYIFHSFSISICALRFRLLTKTAGKLVVLIPANPRHFLGAGNQCGIKQGLIVHAPGGKQNCPCFARMLQTGNTIENPPEVLSSQSLMNTFYPKDF